MNRKICPLTNQNLFIPIQDSTDFEGYIIENKVIGIYNISKFAIDILNDYKEEFGLIIGYCRDYYEKKQTAFVIDTQFLSNIKKLDYPKSFKDKCFHLLKFIYKNSGPERELLSFRSIIDYSITYSDIRMFNRCMDYLFKNSYIKGKLENKNSRGDIYYWDVEITDHGEKKILELDPELIMRDLLYQTIRIGDEKEDNMLNEARKLFFGVDSNFETKRSACEILSKILEPKRVRLESMIGKKDVGTFFEIVNKFDIRHNKKSVLEIKYEEQLEWIFFSLLNSINLYVKALNSN